MFEKSWVGQLEIILYFILIVIFVIIITIISKVLVKYKDKARIINTLFNYWNYDDWRKTIVLVIFGTISGLAIAIILLLLGKINNYIEFIKIIGIISVLVIIIFYFI